METFPGRGSAGAGPDLCPAITAAIAGRSGLRCYGDPAGSGGAIGNSRQIILKRGWVEPAVLWGVLVGDSGTLKSPSIDMAVKYVRKRQAASVEFYRRAIEQYERDVAKSKHGGQKKGDLRRRSSSEPICERFACSDVTVEGLAVLLADTWRGLLLIRDELAGWVGSFDQYKSGHGSDTAHWLTIHGARDLLVDRKNGDQEDDLRPAGGGLDRRRYSAGRRSGGFSDRNILRTVSQHRLLLAMPPRRGENNGRRRRSTASSTIKDHRSHSIKLYSQIDARADDDGSAGAGNVLGISVGRQGGLDRVLQ